MKNLNTPIYDRARQEIIDINSRSELLTVSINRCHDANSIGINGLSKSFTIKYPFSFQYSEILFCNLKKFSPYFMMAYGMRVSLLPTGPK